MDIFDIILSIIFTGIVIYILIHSMIDIVNMNKKQQQDEYIKKMMDDFKKKKEGSDDENDHNSSSWFW